MQEDNRIAFAYFDIGHLIPQNVLIFFLIRKRCAYHDTHPFFRWFSLRKHDSLSDGCQRFFSRSGRTDRIVRDSSPACESQSIDNNLLFVEVAVSSNSSSPIRLHSSTVETFLTPCYNDP